MNLDLSALTVAPFVEVSVRLLALGSLIAAAEDLAAYGVFSDHRLLSWKVVRLRARWTAAGWSGCTADFLFGERAFRWLVVVRLVAAAGLLCTPGSWGLRTPLLGLLALSTLAYNVRAPYGLDGSHQMLVVIAVSLFLASIVPGDVGWMLALWFIGAQSCLSYAAAGMAKLASAEWRSGQAIQGIMRTDMYGNAWLHRLATSRPGAGKALAWAVILFESVFPVALVGPIELTVALLAGGLTFHLANAGFMGLNLFFFAFVAAYPAVLFLALSIGVSEPLRF
jgi:hypothetical protein